MIDNDKLKNFFNLLVVENRKTILPYFRKKIEVETGIRNAGNLEVILGLNEGDKIIAEGLTKVRPGMKVKPIIK